MITKKVITSAFIMLSGYMYCQVGINTETPHATLEIVGNPNSTSVTDGIMIPKVNKLQLSLKKNVYSTEHAGTLIFVSEINAGVPSIGPLVKVTAPGFYFFDGSIWQRITPDIPSLVDKNIYKDDGILTGNRIVAQNDKTLTFNATSKDAFSINGKNDKKIFSADAASNSIGIGTSSPSSKVNILADNEGDTNRNDLNFDGFGTSTNPGIMFRSAKGTAAAPTSLSDGDMIGNITFVPHTSQDFVNGSEIASTYKGNGVNNLTDLTFSTSLEERMRVDENGNVGIGTSSPTEKLDVSGGVKSVKSYVTGMGDADPANTDNFTGVAVNNQTGELVKTAGTAGSRNIYDNNGTVGSNRTVQLTDHLNFDTDTFTIDGTTDRVGVGTQNPAASLEIAAQKTNQHYPDGIIVPKLEKIDLYLKNITTYGAAQTGALVFITEANAGIPAEGPTVNIKSKGFYYFDGNQWQSVGQNGGTPSPETNTNIYNTDGMLTENRVIEQGNKTLDFMTTVPDAFAVHGKDLKTILSVDGASNKVGIGTSTPTNNLDVNGGTRVRSIPNGTTAKESAALFADADGNIRKAEIRELLSNAGILVTSAGHVNKWYGMLVGRSAKISFVGRASVYTNPISFEVLYDANTGFLVTNNTNCEVTAIGPRKLNIKLLSINYELDFTNDGDSLMNAELKEDPAVHWLFGTFFVIGT